MGFSFLIVGLCFKLFFFLWKSFALGYFPVRRRFSFRVSFHETLILSSSLSRTENPRSDDDEQKIKSSFAIFLTTQANLFRRGDVALRDEAFALGRMEIFWTVF